MKKILNSIVEEIQQRCDIVELISNYIPLKRAGRNFKALCPFHHEKTPSFIVSPDKQIFHCFGCGLGGDIFSFVMRFERMEFPEAVKFLAEKAGVEIRREEKITDESAKTSLYQINELATRYFQHNLLSRPEAKVAREYLRQRQINKQSVEFFRLGFALDLWDGVFNFLRRQGISDALIVKAGLAIKTNDGKQYDRFRNRIIFPIFNSQNKIVGFGGRILQKSNANSDQKPKYINSPETEIYVKGNNLYGFNFSKHYIEKENWVAMVEGYFDFIIPFQHGIRNLVASLGTAFTPNHIRFLKRYTNNVVMIFDPDEAGQEATLRSLDLLVVEGLNVKIAQLKPGLDPDSFVRHYGPVDFNTLIRTAADLFDYKLGLLLSKYKKDTPQGKTKIADEILKLIVKVQNAVLRASYIKRLSECLHIPEEALITELKKITTKNSDIRHPRFSKLVGAYKVFSIAEKMLLALMFDDTSLIKEVKKIITYEDFSDPVMQKVAKHLFDSNEKELKPSTLMNRIADEEVHSFICNLLVSDLGIKDRHKSLIDCISKIKQDKIQKKLDELQAVICQVQQEENEPRLKSLLTEYHNLKKEQKEYGKIKEKESLTKAH